MPAHPSIKFGILKANNNSEVTHFTKENLVELSTSLLHAWVWVPFPSPYICNSRENTVKGKPKLAQLLGNGYQMHKQTGRNPYAQLQQCCQDTVKETNYSVQISLQGHIGTN
jgi:hypothetical protein